MRIRSAAALAQLAAICGFLVAPRVAAGQLRCANTEVDTLIRSVSFEGNTALPDEELALHVVSTATDPSRRYFGNSKLVMGTFTALGVAVGANTGDKLTNAGIYGLAGLAAGYGVSRISGVARCLRPGTLAGDILNLSGYYRDRGFIDVRVDTLTRTEGRWVDVTFKVVEGQPVVVDSLVIVGFDTTTLGSLPASFNSREGGRYSPTLTQEDVDSLETRLRDNGYPEGRVDRAVDFLSTYRTRVQFTAYPGIRARIGRISVNQSGIDNRRPSVDSTVILSLLRFREGDRYSERVLFEANQRFYRAGTFLSAEVAPDLRRLATDSVVDVNVTVVEDLRYSGSVEPALGTLDCIRVRGTYGDKAFLSGVNRLDVSGSVSKIGLANGTRLKGLSDACRKLPNVPDTTEISTRELNYNATVRLTRPLPLPGGLLPSVSAYTERRGGYQAYLRTTLIGGVVSVSKSITRTIVFEGSYNLEYGHTDASPTVLCFLFRACDQSARDQLTGEDKRLALIGAKFSRDRRNNIDSASAGGFLRLDLRAANRLILSDRSLEFQKGVIDAAWYRRLGTGVLALRLRAGAISGGQQTGSGARLAPPQERLFLGGENTVRGFSQNELGPLIYVTSDSLSRVQRVLGSGLDTSMVLQDSLAMRIIPAGGNAMYVGNLEYRIPVVKEVQAVFFVDAGAISTSGLSTITGSNQFRYTPGFAIKYFSPVGPVQINFGYNRYDLLDGPVFSDQFPDPDVARRNILKCISGEAGGICQPRPAIRPLPKGSLRRLTLSIAFPPDF